jgi:hypothetical protein
LVRNFYFGTGDQTMTAKKLIIGSVLLVGAAFMAAAGTSSLAQAQGYYGYHPYWYGPRYRGLYNYYGGDGFSRPDVDRGGPGPRVSGGSGAGIGGVR